jgi:hypothetical protein
VPPEQGAGRRDRRNFPQGCAADSVRSAASRRRSSSVRVSRRPPTDAASGGSLQWGRDRLALSAVQPAGQRTQHDLQHSEVDHEAQLISRLP